MRLALGHIKGKIDKRLINEMVSKVLSKSGLVVDVKESLPGHKKMRFKVEDVEIKSGQLYLEGRRVGQGLIDGCSDKHNVTMLDIPDINQGGFLSFDLEKGCRMGIIIPKEITPPTRVEIRSGGYCPSKSQYFVKRRTPYYYQPTEPST